MITPSLPPLPAGFLLFGQGPLNIPAAENQMRDVAQWWDKDHPAAGNDAWNIGGFDGLSSESWYALREGSSIAMINGCHDQRAIHSCLTQLQLEYQILAHRNKFLEGLLNKIAALAESRPAGGGGVGGS